MGSMSPEEDNAEESTGLKKVDFLAFGIQQQKPKYKAKIL